MALEFNFIAILNTLQTKKVKGTLKYFLQKKYSGQNGKCKNKPIDINIKKMRLTAVEKKPLHKKSCVRGWYDT